MAHEKYGLSTNELQTGQFSITPIFTQRPRDASKDWVPKIASYRVTNKLIVKTTNLSLIGKLIDQTSKLGANTIDQISFSLNDPQKFRKAAIDKAVKNAKDDAYNLAQAADVGIKRILNIHLDDAGIRPPPMKSPMLFTTRSAQAAPTTPIESANVEINASVTIIFEIDGHQAKSISLQR